MKKQDYSEMFLRYLIILLIAIPNLFIFYKIFTPLTIYPVYFFLGLFFETILVGTTILTNNVPLQIVNSCVAGSAYYLLFMLNFSTPRVKLLKRIKILLASFLAFLSINIIRITALSFLALSDSSLFEVTHKLSWYALSILFVTGIWFAIVRIYSIKQIPFYSDLKLLYKEIK